MAFRSGSQQEIEARQAPSYLQAQGGTITLCCFGERGVMDQYTQDRSLIAVTTPLGKDVLLLTAFEGEEALSRPFSYKLEMLSANASIAAKDVVGKSVSWLVRRT